MPGRKSEESAKQTVRKFAIGRQFCFRMEGQVFLNHSVEVQMNAPTRMKTKRAASFKAALSNKNHAYMLMSFKPLQQSCRCRTG